MFLLAGQVSTYIVVGQASSLIVPPSSHGACAEKNVSFQLAKVLAQRQSISQIYSTEDLGPDWKFCITFIFKTFFLPKVNYLL